MTSLNFYVLEEISLLAVVVKVKLTVTLRAFSFRELGWIGASSVVKKCLRIARKAPSSLALSRSSPLSFRIARLYIEHMLAVMTSTSRMIQLTQSETISVGLQGKDNREHEMQTITALN